MNILENVVAYARVSTGKVEQADSYESQQAYFQKTLSEENGYNLQEIYADKLSGTDFSKRDSFNKMLFEAGVEITKNSKLETEFRKRYIEYNYIINPNKRPKFTTIYCKSMSRFARNSEVLVILRLLKQQGVGVFFLDIQKNSINSEDMLIIEIMSMLSANESKQISERTKWGKRQTMETGKIHKGFYGYIWNKEENTLRAKEGEAEVVKQIFDLYVNKNMGYRSIYNTLIEKGVKIKIGVIEDAISRKEYCGYIIRNKTSYNFETKERITVDRSEHIEIKSDNVDVLIPEELFEKAQKVKEGRVKHRTGGRPTMMTGKINCVNCGKNLLRDSTYNRKIVYRCYTKIKKGVHVCDTDNLYEEKIFEYLQFILDNKLINRTARFKYDESIVKIENYKTELESKRQSLDIVATKNKIEEIENKQKKLLDLYLGDIINKTILDSKSETLTKELETLNKQLNDYNRPIEMQNRIVGDVVNVLENIKKCFMDFDNNISVEDLIKNNLKSIKVITKYEMIFIFNIGECSISIPSNQITII